MLFLDRFRVHTFQVEKVIAFELSYIDTKHPDFAKYAETCLQKNQRERAELQQKMVDIFLENYLQSLISLFVFNRILLHQKTRTKSLKYKTQLKNAIALCWVIWFSLSIIWNNYQTILFREIDQIILSHCAKDYSSDSAESYYAHSRQVCWCKFWLLRNYIYFYLIFVEKLASWAYRQVASRRTARRSTIWKQENGSTAQGRIWYARGS